jgi:MFS family permease
VKTKTNNGFFSEIFLSQSALPFYSGYTYHHHRRSTIVMGLMGGAMALGGYVMQRGLHATDWEMTALTIVSGLPYLITPFWSQFLRRHGTRGTLSFTPYIEAGAILLMACVWLPWQFIVLIGVNMIAATAMLPVQNFIMQQNYAVTLRGQIFGQLSSFFVLISMGAAFITAFVLDMRPLNLTMALPKFIHAKPLHIYIETFRFVFPLAAVVCLVGRMMFRSIRVRSESIVMAPARKRAREVGYLTNLITSFGEVVKVFKNDKHFFMYEMGFMLYGTAIIMIGPVVPIVANVKMNATYVEYALATILVSSLVQLPLGPVWGRIMDKLKGPRTSLSIYLILIVSMVILWGAVTLNSTWLLGVGFFVQGVGMAGINITWNLGSVEFSKRGEVDRYTSSHVFLVGLRFCYAPVLGVGLMNLLGGPLKGAQWVFLCGTGFLAMASMMMIFLRRSMARTMRAAN